MKQTFENDSVQTSSQEKPAKTAPKQAHYLPYWARFEDADFETRYASDNPISKPAPDNVRSSDVVNLSKVFAKSGGAEDLKVLVVLGTRPEGIKLAPVISELQSHPSIECRVCVTGQHRQMLDDVLQVFGIEADADLNVMKPNQSLGGITSAVLQSIEEELEANRPDWIVVQGDTTTTMAVSLAAFYHRIPVAHVEAGLRTFDKNHPWPEEINRRITGAIADRHYAPTERAKENLLSEGVGKGDIVVTGNTCTDALLATVEQMSGDAQLSRVYRQKYEWMDLSVPLILVTGHRRESFGEGFENICKALLRLAQRQDCQIVYPVHLNPQVQCTVRMMLSQMSNIHLLDPVGYTEFVYLMMRAKFILTDSGGVQEEAPSLGKPVLVMRETSERLEAIEAGVAKLVGTDPDNIVAAASELLDDAARYKEMSYPTNPYGDGKAAQRIVSDLFAVPRVKAASQIEEEPESNAICQPLTAIAKAS